MVIMHEADFVDAPIFVRFAGVWERMYPESLLLSAPNCGYIEQIGELFLIVFV